MKEKHINDKI
jgi:hypothetical protein